MTETGPQEEHSRGLSAVVVLGTYAVAGSVVPIAIRFLTFHFDQVTQNCYRFMAGAAVLLLWAVLAWRGELARLLRSRRGMAGVILTAGGAFATQALYVEGVARTSAVLAAVMAVVSVPLAVTIGALLFADERDVVRRPRFLIGAPLALAGALGLALGGGSGAVEYTAGARMLLVAVLIGAGISQLSKRLVLSFNPLCIAALSTTLQAVAFGVVMVGWGNPEQVLSAPGWVVTVMLLSGVYGLLVGGALYYYCMGAFGLTRTVMTGLASPVFTGALGYLWLREGMHVGEGIAAAVVLVGCYLVIGGKETGVSTERTREGSAHEALCEAERTASPE